MSYSYQLNLASGTTVYSMDRKTIGALKDIFIRYQNGSFAKSDVEEIVVYRGNKIHGFYDENFNLNNNIGSKYCFYK
jgi:hypothetical protein